MPYYIDESSFVVADVGSFATRVGLSGMELPSGSFPSSVGVIENDTLNSTSKSNKNTLTSSTNEKSYHFDVENFREHMGIENPYDNNGLITNWDVLEKIYEYSYSKYLKCKSNERPIIIAEKSNNNTQQLMKNREQLCELMFETFEVPGFYIGNDATLALYANGYTSGTVVDIGHSGSTITPILNGYADTECVESFNIGGSFMDMYMEGLLRDQGISLVPPFHFKQEYDTEKNDVVAKEIQCQNVNPTYDRFRSLQVARDLRESVSIMSRQPASTDPEMLQLPVLPYELPDGHLINIGVNRYMVTEVLCNPSSISYNHKFQGTQFVENDTKEGLQSLVLKATTKASNKSFQTYEKLMENLVVTGGTSCIENVPHRIYSEVQQLVAAETPDVSVQLVCMEPEQRQCSSFIGGSLLASMPAFRSQAVMTKDMYNEHGSHFACEFCP